MTATTRRTAPAGLALLGATVVALPVAAAPATPAPAWSIPSIELTGSAALDLVDSVSGWLAPTLASVLDTLPAAPDIGETISIAASATGNFLAPVAEGIQAIYDGVEPWVQYGANLLSWGVGWVPFIGLLAPQINIFYDLGESIVRTLLFNSTDFLAGLVGFGEGLSNIASATAEAIHTFITAEIDWILPPLPPIGLAATMLPDLATALGPDLTTVLAPGADLGAGALSGVAGDLAAHLSQLLLGLLA